MAESFEKPTNSCAENVYHNYKINTHKKSALQWKIYLYILRRVTTELM